MIEAKTVHTLKNSFAYSVVCCDDKFSKPTALYREKNANIRFIEAILEEMNYCKK